MTKQNRRDSFIEAFNWEYDNWQLLVATKQDLEIKEHYRIRQRLEADNFEEGEDRMKFYQRYRRLWKKYHLEFKMKSHE